ncbi:MAG: cysteine desulfurase [Lachnospiraceae bacterium]|nr:cysteine desulfurase [Lachnospiraceae bacterium]
MEAYLDNAATTRVSDGVRDVMERTMSVDFGNPSSLHRKGVEAERYIRAAAEQAARSLKAQPKEIVFTSGGTESNNLALIGAALAMRRRGKHLIATQFEHASVNSPLLFLEEMGFTVDFAPVDELGHVLLPELCRLVRPDTVLVSVMYVNNELGAVQDIAALSAAVRAKNPGILFHADAIQAYGKYRICPKKEGIDLLSVSGHKIHGPKGSGFLYIRDGVRIRPILWGGGQQRGMRSGTENVPAIAGLGRAIEEIYTEHERKVSELYGLKKRLLERLSALPGVTVNAVTEPLSGCAPHIVSASFEGVRSEVLLHALEERGVYVSSGSACSSNHPGISGSLRAIGVREELLDSTLRFSFSKDTQEEEIDYAAAQLSELLPVLRRYTRR